MARGITDTDLLTLQPRLGGYQGSCTCGWRSPLEPDRAAAAQAMLRHSAVSPCHALVGETPSLLVAAAG